ncbi:ras family-domain-containing protein [Tribonema minus]|uniref:Ras family-domain-containing protein n=1 Tax=Tribonema minus TaxID=303371 RepID=A0A836CMP4_9STRA|nr:ras family-domain-containing protein [Tribonema minus]|eukprot:TRINITY_DN5460_c0_g1_i1.p1 TRINITY_DN5460_c0_g1~~TRINITY_DN5460_c0_g1_i1.p1  ORF type:complete len:204 (+),score=44.00 TRINITY_DN5460_c0_g1_i1:129-740(+)
MQAPGAGSAGRGETVQVAKRKIALLGFTGVGKTSLATRFVQGSFVDMYNPTITNTFHTSVNFGKKTLATEILDTAGLDGHTQISRHASVGVHGYLMLYSTISRNSFENIKNINENLMHTLGDLPDVARVLVGTMMDLSDQRQITTQQGQELAREWGVPFMECSAKENINIDAVFKCLIKEVEQAQGGTVEEEPPAEGQKCIIA